MLIGKGFQAAAAARSARSAATGASGIILAAKTTIKPATPVAKPRLTLARATPTATAAPTPRASSLARTASTAAGELRRIPRMSMSSSASSLAGLQQIHSSAPPPKRSWALDSFAMASLFQSSHSLIVASDRVVSGSAVDSGRSIPPRARTGGGTPTPSGGGAPPTIGEGTPLPTGGGAPPTIGGGTPPPTGGGTPPTSGPSSSSSVNRLCLAGLGFAFVMAAANEMIKKSDADNHIHPMSECPIPAADLTEANLQGIGADKTALTAMAASISDASSTAHQTGYVSSNTASLISGHTYAVMGKAETLTDDQIQAVRDSGIDTMRDIVSGFPNGGREITPEHLQHLVDTSGVTDMRPLIPKAEVDAVAAAKKGKPIDGPILLGSGGVVHGSNHTSFETDRYIVNSFTPITSELHPLEGTATWIHVIDKTSKKATFAVVGAGEHRIPPTDVVNNCLVGKGGLWDHVGQTYHAKLKGTPPPAPGILLATDSLSPVAAQTRLQANRYLNGVD